MRAAGRRFYGKRFNVTDEEFDKAKITDSEVSPSDTSFSQLLLYLRHYSPVPELHSDSRIWSSPFRPRRRPCPSLRVYAREQIIACRLYTGPMFQKYNFVLRNGVKGVYVMTIRYVIASLDLTCLHQFLIVLEKEMALLKLHRYRHCHHRLSPASTVCNSCRIDLPFRVFRIMLCKYLVSLIHSTCRRQSPGSSRDNTVSQ